MSLASHRFSHNPYFEFHPLQALFSLVAALILFGLILWFLAVPVQ